MRRKSRLLVGIIIFLLLVGVGSVLGYNYFKPQVQPVISALTGFTTLSLSQAQFTSTNQFFSGNAWILTVAQGGLSQYVEGIISKSDVGSNSGTQPQKDLKIDITYSKQTCEYGITRNYEVPSVNTYEYKEWTCAWFDDNTRKNYCSDTYWLYAGKYPVSFTCFCINEVPLTGAVAYNTIQNPNIHTVSTIGVSNGVESYSMDVDTKGDIKGMVGNNVYVIWNGYLSKDVCDSQAQYYGFYRDGSWKLGYASNYETYKTQYDTQIGTLNNYAQNNWNVNSQMVKNAVDLLNQARDKTLQTAYFGQIDKVNSLTDAMIIQDLKSFASVPLYTFYVKADWLGVYQPEGKPEILEVNSPKFLASSEGTIYAKFKNIGDGRGTFTIWADCKSPFRQVGTSQDFSLEPQQTQVAYIKISADTNQPISSICSVNVKVLTTQVSKDVSVSVDPQKVCLENSYVCESNAVKQCNSFGSGYNVIQQCNATQECLYDTAGKSYCKDKSVIGVGGVGGICPPIFGFIPDISCLINQWLIGINVLFQVFVIVLSVIGGLIIFVLSYMTLKRLLPDRQDKILVWVISIAITVLSSILIYLVWWLLFIIAIALLVLKFAIPVKKGYREFRRI